VADDDTTQQIIINKGATVDFSGGGYRYAAGGIPTTKLVSGNSIYDISNAPEWLSYSKILTVNSYFAGCVQGSDAGSLGVLARKVAIDGRLAGSATRGAYQTLQAELTDKVGDQNTQGRAEAAGGTLTIGSNNVQAVVNGQQPGWSDYVTNGIEVTATGAPPAGDTGVNSILSAATLNAAGLSTLSLYANQTFTLEQGRHHGCGDGQRHGPNDRYRRCHKRTGRRREPQRGRQRDLLCDDVRWQEHHPPR
jgi:hypothetical protein